MDLRPQHRTTLDRNQFPDLPREWAIHYGTLWWDQITPGLQAIRRHSITEPATTWALPADRHHLLLTIQGDAAITRTEGDPITAAPAHAVHIPPQTSSAPMMVHPGPTPWQAIVITYPAPNDHTHTRQQRWEDIRGDLLQEHLGLTRTHHTLLLVGGVGQAPHGIHTPGLWAYATPMNPQAAEDIRTALWIQQAQTQTPHCNTQRGYTIWWAYQDHDILTPQSRPPPPPEHQHPRPPPGRSSGSHQGRCPGNLEPAIPGRDQSGAARESPRKAPSAETAPPPTQARQGGRHHPRRMGGPLHHPAHHHPQERRPQDHRHPPPPPHHTGA